MDIMVGDYNADILIFQLFNNTLYVLHCDRVNAGERFVEQDEFGVGGEASGDFHATSFTAGKVVSFVVTHLLDIELRYQALQFLFLLRLALSAELQDGTDVVLHRHVPEHRGLLRQVGDTHLCTLVHRLLRYILVVQKDSARKGFNQSHNHVERSGFARTIRTEQPHNLPLREIDGNFVDDRAVLVFLN